MTDFKSGWFYQKLPTKNADPGFLPTASFVETPLWKFTPPLTPEDKLNCAIENIFQLGLHFLYKEKWDSKHKIKSCPRELRNQAKLLGELLSEYLNLCSECSLRANASNLDVPTQNQWEWFVCVFWEIKLESFQAPKKHTGKRQSIQNQREKIFDLLQKGINPIDAERQPNIKKLFDICIIQASISDRFRKTHWKSFLAKSREYLSEQQNQPGVVRIMLDEKGICYFSGRGKHVKRIT